MRVTGKVVKIDGSYAFIEASRPASCEHCANSGLCNKRNVEIQAHNDIGAEAGDWVEVETNEGKEAHLILAYLFLTPIAILLLASFLFTVSPWLTLTALPLTAIYYVILRKINKNHPVRARITGPAAEPQSCADLVQK
jgi:positive regulator of sigma E activity